MMGDYVGKRYASYTNDLDVPGKTYNTFPIAPRQSFLTLSADF
jgi:hypothetical protein